MSKLNIDPRAAAALDERATQLLAHVQKRERAAAPQPGWQPQVHSVATLTEDDVSEMDVGNTDLSGAYISLEFLHDGDIWVLEGAGYQELKKLIQLLLKAPPVGELVSKKTIENMLRVWVQKRYRGHVAVNATTYLLDECARTIGPYRVWVPFERLYLQNPIAMGKGSLRPITPEFLEAILDSKGSDFRARATERLRHYQGYTAFVMECEAEIERAREIALVAAERTLAGLSLMSAATLHGSAASAICLWGSRRLRSATTFVFGGETLRNMTEGVLGSPSLAETIDLQTVATFGWLIRGLNALLLLDKPDTLAEKVLDALSVYRRAIITSETAEKLIYICVALEMVLLRNATEPVQDNVAHRIAFLIGNTVDERRDILHIVKDGYALRSAFIHHGIGVRDAQQADGFLTIAWRTFVELVRAAQTHATKDELIMALETRKLR